MARVNQLLLLLLVCVVVPCCWSLCDISAARRQAHRGTCQQVARPFKESEAVAKQAADQAGVVFEKLIEAYKVSCYFYPVIGLLGYLKRGSRRVLERMSGYRFGGYFEDAILLHGSTLRWCNGPKRLISVLQCKMILSIVLYFNNGIKRRVKNNFKFISTHTYVPWKIATIKIHHG